MFQNLLRKFRTALDLGTSWLLAGAFEMSSALSIDCTEIYVKLEFHILTPAGVGSSLLFGRTTPGVAHIATKRDEAFDSCENGWKIIKGLLCIWQIVRNQQQ